MTDSASPDWLSSGEGTAPKLRWTYATESALVTVDVARETGEVLAGDTSGGLYLLDRTGRVSSLSRGLHPLTALAWSDAGQGGAAVIGGSRLYRLLPNLEVAWSMDLPDEILTVGVDSYGQYVAVALANGGNYVFDSYKGRVGQFETVRPLNLLRFLVTDPVLLGAAEYGLLCCHLLSGEQLWSEKMWTNIGDLAATGDGGTILVAGFTHGLQSFDAQGTNRGAYIVEGTPNRVAITYQPDRVVAATLERNLYWLDADGEMLWGTTVEEDVRRVACDPLGNWVVCALAGGRIDSLGWDIGNGG